MAIYIFPITNYSQKSYKRELNINTFLTAGQFSKGLRVNGKLHLSVCLQHNYFLPRSQVNKSQFFIFTCMRNLYWLRNKQHCTICSFFIHTEMRKCSTKLILYISKNITVPQMPPILLILWSKLLALNPQLGSSGQRISRQNGGKPTAGNTH